MIGWRKILIASLLAAIAGTAQAATTTDAAAPNGSSGIQSNPIPPGTTITMQNWQSYRQVMPDGMAAFFEGTYFWKMPRDVAMPVGRAILHPLPPSYLEATEKYSGQVSISELSDGGLTMAGYKGGIPFPQPEEPHKGWKVLADLWFRYTPHITVNTRGVVCFNDSNNLVSCKAGMRIYRQLAFNTDPGAPAIYPDDFTSRSTAT